MSLKKGSSGADVKVSVRDSNGGTAHWYVCEHRQAPIQPGDNFCHECGRAVKWV